MRVFEGSLDHAKATRAAQVQRFVQDDAQCTLAVWGLEVGDGWLPIVDDLFTQLEAYCADRHIALPHLVQIKEKLGTLRVYRQRNWGEHPTVQAEDEAAIQSFIAQATDLALNTCEDCGRRLPAVDAGAYGWLRCGCAASRLLHGNQASGLP